MHTLLLKICDGARQRSTLVCVVEYVTSSNCFCVQRSNAQNIIEPVVVGMMLDAINRGLHSKKASTSKTGEASKLSYYFVVNGHDKVDIEQINGLSVQPARDSAC